MDASNGVDASAASPSPLDLAIPIVCAKHLHQCLWLPQSDSHGRLRVTFSTTSNFADTTLPTVLVAPPMFGGRWMLLDLDNLAKSQGVRLVCADRYGLPCGLKTFVQAHTDRLQTWDGRVNPCTTENSSSSLARDGASIAQEAQRRTR